MTDQEKQDLEFPLLEGMGEAGGIAFTEIRHIRHTEDGGAEMLRINLTGRGRNALEAFENLATALKQVQAKGWTVYTPTKELPKVEKKSLPTPVAPASPIAQPAVGVAPQPQVTDGGTISVVKIVSTPRADGKISLGFFGEGRKYPDITKVCTVEQAVMTLSTIGSFTPDHFKAVAEYDGISAEVVWVASEKLNSRGVPYKNIVEVKAV